MDWFTAAWLGWGGYFAIVEAKALLNDKTGDTLSEHIWRWFAVKDSNAANAKVRRTGLLVGLAWLVTHFMTGGFV